MLISVNYKIWFYSNYIVMTILDYNEWLDQQEVILYILS